ncbi:MAG TPA: hypothetical protein VM735_03165 [Candidatus Kapabacteria bacterium]|nr:hypothetical protein [Candidatus Kapabacteria bacterium]
MNYTSYKNLPSLAGLCSIEDAARPGLSVEECVARLKRYHYGLKRLSQIFIARITAEPIYELKTAFSLHAHYCAEHVTELRKRVGEMREPPLGLEQVPVESLQIFFDEVLSASSTEALLLGLYEKAVPALIRSLKRHREQTNPLADAPSSRLCRFALLELEDMERFGRDAISKLVNADTRAQLQGWLTLLDNLLAAAGDLDGTQPVAAHNPDSLSRQFSARPYKYDGFPKRDERFPDPYNMGVNAEVFLYDEQFSPEEKTLMMFYKRIREIDVPEMMSSIITETEGKPWAYYRDMIRQLWDEARHAMMGEVGFVNAGVDWRKVMVNFTWSMALNTQLKPIERHAVLYFIEQGLMPKTGKRYEWEVGVASRNPLAATFQDYDWADEVLHARIGRDWYLKEFNDPREAVKYGDDCWSKVLMGWEEWRKKGLTEHRNWWPDVYKEACARWGVQPDERVLAYHTTYQEVRADLKNLAVSG